VVKLADTRRLKRRERKLVSVRPRPRAHPKREIVRRLGTSAAQLYRLLDQTNYAKSIDQMLNLLRVLDCEVDLVVRARTA